MKPITQQFIFQHSFSSLPCRESGYRYFALQRTYLNSFKLTTYPLFVYTSGLLAPSSVLSACTLDFYLNPRHEIFLFFSYSQFLSLFSASCCRNPALKQELHVTHITYVLLIDSSAASIWRSTPSVVYKELPDNIGHNPQTPCHWNIGDPSMALVLVTGGNA